MANDSDFEVMGPYAVALLMSIGAVFIFIWAVLSGALSGVDVAAIRSPIRILRS